jgi:hypothetical protein
MTNSILRYSLGIALTFGVILCLLYAIQNQYHVYIFTRWQGDRRLVLTVKTAYGLHPMRVEDSEGSQWHLVEP